MNIASRQSHLCEMGIPQWYARFMLQGAAESPNLHFDVVPESQVKRETKATIAMPEKIAISEMLPASVALKEVSNNFGGQKPDIPIVTLVDESVVDEPTKVTNDPRVSSTVVPRISLAVFVSDTYIVISDVAGSNTYNEEQVLLLNIIKSFDQSSIDFRLQGSFNWPVFNSLKVLAANDLMHEKLLSRWLSGLNLPKYRAMMYFGSQNEVLISKLLRELSLGENYSLCPFLCFSDSLSDLLKMPARKAHVWEKLPSDLKQLDGIKLGVIKNSV